MEDKVVFIEETHTYLVNGVIVPSTTQIIKCILGNMYEGVDTTVLKRASERGTAIHRDIELQEYQTEEGQAFKSIIDKNNFKVLENESKIIIYVKGKPFCCGTIDNVFENEKGEYELSDTKTTYEVHREYLEIQLNMYRIGLEQKTGKKIAGLNCVHLPKSKKYDIYKVRLLPDFIKKLEEIQEIWEKQNIQ